MLLLSDGTVMAANSGGNGWFQLTPDNNGSYISGTWRTLSSMHDTRLYYSSAVLQDGRVFVAGGEYGTGKESAEVYDPLSDRWTFTPLSWQSFSDSVSKILPGGKVLVAPVGPVPSGSTIIYDPNSNSWTPGGKLFRGGHQDEASWVKLPDDSILTIDPFGTNSERYIPASNTWINDANLPVRLYDPYGDELGAGFLLADGRAFFLGSSGHTAFYTPTGDTSPGTWIPGPDFPNGQGTPDAPAAVMANGRILCVTSPAPTSADHFPKPASFYEYDPIANSFTSVPVPGTLTSLQQYVTRMLDLPDGTVLFSYSSSQLYVYQPDGAPLAAGKPTVTSISQNNDGSFHLVGTLLNGISEGAAYGDDAQMSSSYPLIRLTNSSRSVVYARTFNWSSTSVMTDNRQLSTEFTLPTNLPPDVFSLVVSANGNASDPVPFTTTVWNGAPSGAWDFSTTNWLKSGTAANYNEGDFVIFDDTVAGTVSLDMETTLSPGGILFKNSLTNYVLGGAGLVAGSGGLVLNGSGTVTLAETGGDNFSGGITVNKGTLILDTANSAVSGGMTVAAGASLVVGKNDPGGALPSGNITNNGLITFDQTTDLAVNNAISGVGALIKNNGNTLTFLGTNTWTGSTIVNAGILALATNASLAGTTNLMIAAGAALSVTNRTDGTFTLSPGQLLQGNGAIVGNLAAPPGSNIVPGTNQFGIGALTVLGNTALQGAISMKINYGDPVPNDVLNTTGIVYGGVLLLSNLSSTPLVLGDSFRLFAASNYSGAFSAIIPPIPAPGLAWDTNSLTTDGTLFVGFTPGDTWVGSIDGNWDNTTLNWSTSGTPANYKQGDSVTFDDSVRGISSVILTEALTPASMSFNNSSSNYAFSGNGSLTVTNGLTKNLAGTVLLSETGGDNFSGGISVSNGTLILDNVVSAVSGDASIAPGATLQLGLNDTNGMLPPGNLLLNGLLVLDRTDGLVLSQSIVGTGALVKSNSNLVRVSRNNLNWKGMVDVVQGTLQLGSFNALGSGTNVLVRLESGATLDFNGITGTNAVVASGDGIGGNGAIVNNNPLSQALPALSFLTLAGNTTIGGLDRWDLRPAGSAPDTAGADHAGLSTLGQPFNLIKTGPNVVGIVSATIDSNLANITVQLGTLNFEGDLPGLGNPSSTLTVFTNATLEFQNLGRPLSKSILLNDGATVLNGGGQTILDRPVVLNTNSSGGPGNCTFNISGSYLWMNPAVISGPGGLTKIGASTLRLSGTNTYKGSTLINGGTLSLWSTGSILSSTNISIASGATLKAADRPDLTLALTNGQTLSGNGTVTGILLAGAGSTLLPGSGPTGIGTLTVSSNITLQGATVLKLNATSGVNDVLRGYSVSYGGSLTLTNISAAPLAAGTSFRLFVATNYSGAFSALDPFKPGPGLQWNTTSLLLNGTLSVEALPSPQILSFALSGTDLVLKATNGVAGSSYSVLMSTNISLPLPQWMPVATNTLAANGSFTIVATNSVDPAAPQRFYALQAR
jgi:autotransporter-associated beta strand protein